MVLCNKYVMGHKSGISIVVLMIVGKCATFSCWVIFNNSFFPFYIYIIGGLFLLLTEIFYCFSFCTEPGIIPRNHPDFQKKQSTENNNNNNINIQSLSITKKRKNTQKNLIMVILEVI